MKTLDKMGKDLIFWLLYMIKMVEQDGIMILSIESMMGVSWKFEKSTYNLRIIKAQRKLSDFYKEKSV